MKTLATQPRRAAKLLCALLAVPAFAQAAPQTWVSGVGDDANTCGRFDPCKTFAGAIVHTDAGGIISVLDPGGFGSVTLNKSITIDGNGFVASILNAGQHGITVNAAPSDVIVVRNLVINGVNNGGDGIRFLNGGALHLVNVRIEGQAIGIDFAPNTAAELTVTGGTITRTTNAIYLRPGEAATALVTIDGTSVVGNRAGLRAERGTIASVSDAVISDNDFSGIVAASTTGVAQITVRDSLIAGNNLGAVATSAGVKAHGAAATVNLQGNSIVGNGYGLLAPNGGTITSSGANHIFSNHPDGAPTSTVPTL